MATLLMQSLRLPRQQTIKQKRMSKRKKTGHLPRNESGPDHVIENATAPGLGADLVHGLAGNGPAPAGGRDPEERDLVLENGRGLGHETANVLAQETEKELDLGIENDLDQGTKSGRDPEIASVPDRTVVILRVARIGTLKLPTTESREIILPIFLL